MKALTIEQQYPVQLGELTRVVVILAGCGGTGSFLALHLARLAYEAREHHDLDLDLYFVDPDVVEPANVGRQNFAPGAELGQNKALTLASRYSAAFGLDIRAYPIPIQEFDPRLPYGRSRLLLVVGAVDNRAARRHIDGLFPSHGYRKDWYWIDCGNHDNEAGQVLIGNSRAPEPVINPLGFCSQLPLPSVQAPDLIEAPADEGDGGNGADGAGNESCADLLLRGTQSLMINQMVASWAAHYLYRLLITRDLEIYATYFNLPGGKADSVPITGTPGDLSC